MNIKLSASTVKALQPCRTVYDANDDELKGFLVRVSPTGGKVYYIRYRTIAGRERRMKVGSAGRLKCDEARAEARKLLARVELGEDPAEEKREIKADTLQSFIDDSYTPHVEANHVNAKETLRVLRRDFKDLLGRKLADITSWDVAQWAAKELKDGRKPSSVIRKITCLRAALKQAVDWGKIAEFKLQGVTKGLSKKLDRTKRPRYLSPEERARLFSAIDAREVALQSPDMVRPVIVLALNTGLRRGEIFGLVWENVRFSERVLTVAGSGSKTAQSRDVPLNESALAALRDWQRVTGARSGLVFPNDVGGRQWHINRAWRELLAAANIKAFTFHNLRSDFASQLAIAGVSIQTIQQLLGHRTIQMTMIYAGLSPQVRADAVARLNPRVITDLDAERANRA